MAVGLINREMIRAISPALEDELDNIIAGMQNRFLVEHDDKGHHTNITVKGITTPSPAVYNRQLVTPSVSNINTINRINLPSTIVPPGGSSSGDVVGPASAVDTDICAFNGATGKLIEDSGYTIAQLAAAIAGAGAAAAGATIIVTDSQIKTLNSVPLTLVAGIGGKIIMPVMLTMEKGPWTNAYSANPSVSLRWAGIASDLTSSFGASFGGTAFAGFAGMGNSPSWTSSAVGKSLTLRSTADVTSVGSTVGNTATFRYLYYLI